MNCRGRLASSVKLTMTKELTAFDPADHLKSGQSIPDYTSAALESNDSAYVADAQGVVAHTRGTTEFACRTRLSRKQLCRSFCTQGCLTLRTTLAVIQAVGSQFCARRAEVSKA